MTAAPKGPDRPMVDVESKDWWAAIQEGRLMVNACQACDRISLYVRPFCPNCWSQDVELQPATGRARLYTWTVVHQNAAPFAERTPYVVAMVDLLEGPRLMTVLEDCDIEDLRTDLDLEVAFRSDDGFAIPVFRPKPS